MVGTAKKRPKSYKRPDDLELEANLLQGPFEKKETLFQQLDIFFELETKARKRGYQYTYDEVSKFFGMSLLDFTQAISSPGFANYCLAISKIKAQMKTRYLDTLASAALEQLYKDKKNKDFLTQYKNRLEQIGFVDIKTEDLEDLRRDEGEKVISQFKECLCKLNGGTLPPIQRVLAMVLGHSNDGEGGDHTALEENSGPDPTDAVVGPERPDPGVGTPYRPSEGDAEPTQAGDSSPGEPVG